MVFGAFVPLAIRTRTSVVGFGFENVKFTEELEMSVILVFVMVSDFLYITSILLCLPDLILVVVLLRVGMNRFPPDWIGSALSFHVPDCAFLVMETDLPLCGLEYPMLLFPFSARTVAAIPFGVIIVTVNDPDLLAACAGEAHKTPAMTKTESMEKENFFTRKFMANTVASIWLACVANSGCSTNFRFDRRYPDAVDTKFAVAVPESISVAMHAVYDLLALTVKLILVRHVT